MKAMGVDFSLNGCGLAILEGTWPTFTTKTQVSAKQEGNFYERIRYVEKFVNKMVVDERPEVICIEAPIVGEQMTEMAWAIYVLILRTIQENHPCLVVCPTNSSVKSIVFRKRPGDVSKTMIRDKAKAELNITGRFSADEGDAYFLAKVGWKFYLLLTSQLSRSSLDDKETHVYLTEELNSKGVKKGIIHREGDLYYDWRPKDGSK